MLYYDRLAAEAYDAAIGGLDSQPDPEYYTTRGPVRGGCGHQHRTVETAARCLERDRRYCRRVGGYSDRSVARSDGKRLSQHEDDLCFGVESGQI